MRVLDPFERSGLYRAIAPPGADGISQNLLVRKLENFGPLPTDDCRFLDGLVGEPREVGSRVDLIGVGDTPNDVHLILQGFACRYKHLPDGRRQIMAYLVPGDFCDIHVFILKEMDHSIGTLSRCKVVDIPRPRILELTERPAIARALWWATLVDEAILREWIVNGVRAAGKRIAHLLCELLVRLRSVGLAGGDTFELPITQIDLADSLGLSVVHVNRKLQQLRQERLITLKGRELVVLDAGRLMRMSGFTANYLHLGQRAGTIRQEV